MGKNECRELEAAEVELTKMMTMQEGEVARQEAEACERSAQECHAEMALLQKQRTEVSLSAQKMFTLEAVLLQEANEWHKRGSDFEQDTKELEQSVRRDQHLESAAKQSTNRVNAELHVSNDRIAQIKSELHVTSGKHDALYRCLATFSALLVVAVAIYFGRLM